MKKFLSSLLLFVGVAEAQDFTQPNYASATVAFGSVTVGYSTILANTQAWISVDILNTGNNAIRCTFDGGTTSFLIPASSSYSPDFGMFRKYESSPLQCRYDTAALTSGGINVIAMY